MGFLKKSKIALFGLLMSFFGLVEKAPGQAIPKNLLHDYYREVHALHQEGTNAVEADAQFHELSDQIADTVRARAKNYFLDHDFEQARIQLAILEALANAVRDTTTANAVRDAREEITFLVDSDEISRSTISQGVQQILGLSKQELEQLLAQEEEYQQPLFVMNYLGGQIRYFEKMGAVVTLPEKTPPVSKQELVRETVQRLRERGMSAQMRERILEAIIKKFEEHGLLK